MWYYCVMDVYLPFILAGGAGAIAKDLVIDNKLQLPKFDDGYCCLGFLGGFIIGAFVGMVVDHNILTSGLAGYVGSSAISHLLPGGTTRL